MRHRKVHALREVRCNRCHRTVYSQSKKVACMKCEPTEMQSLREPKHANTNKDEESAT